MTINDEMILTIGNNVKIYVLNANGELDRYIHDLQIRIVDSFELINQKILVDNLDIVFYNNPQKSIPRFGIGARCYTPYTILVALNPKLKKFKELIDTYLGAILAEEIHHCLRWRVFGRLGGTLFKAMVSEGLGCWFGREVSGIDPLPWCIALDDNLQREMMQLAIKEFDNEYYDRQGWYFGSDKEGIPKWTIYSLGYSLVERYLMDNPDNLPSTLIDRSAEDFLPYV